MNISLKTEGVADVQRALATLQRSTAKKAVVLWANWIGLEAQGEMRRQLGSRFTFRGTADRFEKAIVFEQATTGGRREAKAQLVVGGPQYGDTATRNLGNILARHENAEVRTQADEVYYDGRGRAFRAGFFVPARGLRTAQSNPPRAMYPSAIGAALRLTPDSRVILAKGTKKGSRRKGTGTSYFATPKGIFRRRHTNFGGRVDVEAVWWFVPRIASPARLGLWTTAEQVFASRALPLGLQAVEEALFRETL